MNFKKGSPESAGIPSGCLLHFLDRYKKTGSNAQFSFNAA